MGRGYLIYHPERQITKVGKMIVHHDGFGGNEDPYLWNTKFLHTFCHITQLRNEIGQTNFWVSGDKYPNFTKLYCDCVFVVEEKHPWKQANRISFNDKIVETKNAFAHHYQWVNPPHNHHHFARRSRYTLKAHPTESFQPQTDTGNLIDILHVLNKLGYSTNDLINGITSKRGSRPFRLSEDAVVEIHRYLLRSAAKTITGKDLERLHPNSIASGNTHRHRKC